jgi:PIN domain nuclease of toxin-antitoxin system
VNSYVADTHALYWHLEDQPRLGPAARAAFDEAERGEATIYVSAITIAELYYLLAKQKLDSLFPAIYQRIVAAAYVRLVPLLASDLLEFDQVRALPEMHDRIIVGLAIRLGVPCLTRDAIIVNSGLAQVVW